MGIEDVILEAVRKESFEKGFKEGLKEGFKEGFKEGREKAKNQISLRMKKAGFSAADIVVATGLTKEQVAQL